MNALVVYVKSCSEGGVIKNILEGNILSFKNTFHIVVNRMWFRLKNGGRLSTSFLVSQSFGRFWGEETLVALTHNKAQQSDCQKCHGFCVRKSSATFVNRSARRYVKN